ncbi:MAG: hypothetical protein J6T10_15920, partial [Methanobrevibacter sp.]|nr:hypothetical protein [Methanobrevibacter sp.]
YHTYDSIANDADIIEFENILIDYDNHNSTTYYDQFVEAVNICDIDTIKDMLFHSCDTVFDVDDYVCDVNDQDREFYKVDCYNCLTNVYISDLRDFVTDLR